MVAGVSLICREQLIHKCELCLRGGEERIQNNQDMEQKEKRKNIQSL